MPLSKRAKQFIPYAAVSGLTEALHRVETDHARQERPELSEEQAEEINSRLCVLREGQEVSLLVYDAVRANRRQITGRIRRIDRTMQTLLIAGTDGSQDTVYYHDILQIREACVR